MRCGSCTGTAVLITPDPRCPPGAKPEPVVLSPAGPRGRWSADYWRLVSPLDRPPRLIELPNHPGSPVRRISRLLSRTGGIREGTNQGHPHRRSVTRLAGDRSERTVRAGDQHSHTGREHRTLLRVHPPSAQRDQRAPAPTRPPQPSNSTPVSTSTTAPYERGYQVTPLGVSPDRTTVDSSLRAPQLNCSCEPSRRGRRYRLRKVSSASSVTTSGGGSAAADGLMATPSNCWTILRIGGRLPPAPGTPATRLP